MVAGGRFWYDALVKVGLELQISAEGFPTDAGPGSHVVAVVLVNEGTARIRVRGRAAPTVCLIRRTISPDVEKNMTYMAPALTAVLPVFTVICVNGVPPVGPAIRALVKSALPVAREVAWSHA